LNVERIIRRGALGAIVVGLVTIFLGLGLGVAHAAADTIPTFASDNCPALPTVLDSADVAAVETRELRRENVQLCRLLVGVLGRPTSNNTPSQPTNPVVSLLRQTQNLLHNGTARFQFATGTCSGATKVTDGCTPTDTPTTGTRKFGI